MLSVDSLKGHREGNRLEFKRAEGGLPHSFWETYSSFSNTDGGIVVLGAVEGTDGLPVPSGIGDVGSLLKDLWDGLNSPQRASANILVGSDVTVEDWEGREVVLVHVPRADRRMRPVYVGNNPRTGTYRRSGEGDYHVAEETYRSMVRDSAPESADRTVLDAFSLDDLHSETVRGYRNLFRSTRPGHPWTGLSDEAFLTRIGAIARSGDDHALHPTRAGLLMFGEAWRIVSEFPRYLLDCRQELADNNRWNNRLVSGSGDWSGNVLDFWGRASRMLTEGLPVPFRLGPNMRRIDDTPQHRAVREALTNALVHADYSGRTGVVLVRKPDRVIASNPGTLRIALDEVEAGGVSDPRNETMLFMFSLINIGERAGSGFDVLREGARSAGKPEPLLEELYEPDRVRLTLQLEISGLVGFHLPGMGGEGAPLVTAVKPPSGQSVIGADGANAGAVVGANGANGADSGANAGGGTGGAGGPFSDEGARVLDALRANPRVSAVALGKELGMTRRQIQRVQGNLKGAGILERVGGTRGYWRIKA